MSSDNNQIAEVTERLRLPREGSNGAERFVKMLEKHGPMPVRRGQIIEGEIISLEENLAIIDIGAKRDAIVPPEEMEAVDESFLDQLNEGDNVYVYVTRTPIGDEELLVSLDKGLREQDWARAARCLENQESLEMKIVGKNKGGLLVEFGRLQGFIPTSHVPQLQRLRNQGALAGQKAKLIGEELLLNVIEVDRQHHRLVLSAKTAQEERRAQRLLELKRTEGETITGIITSLVDFGAFVDLDGVEGLLHISEIAWQKVERPDEYLNQGEELDVLIKSVDVENERVSLSRKALQTSPWELFAQTHADGDLVEGVVVDVVDYGAFVRISEGIDGLLHVSEMDGTRDFAPQDLLFPDDIILVRILNIQPERQRLALSQRRVSQDEELGWDWHRQQSSAMLADEEE
jgi:small subunit ribosomal protein S1